MHITDVSDFIYMMISQKAIRLIYNCGEVLGGLCCLKPYVSHQHTYGKKLPSLDNYQKKSFILPYNFHNNLLSQKQILFLLQLCLSNASHYRHLFATNNSTGLAEHISVFHSRQPLLGRHADFAPLELNGGFVHTAELVLRKSGINYFVCVTENNFYLL